MPTLEPLPFRLGVAGDDVIDSAGIRSVSYRVEGLLHLVDDTLRFEWSATETTEEVSGSRIGTVVDHSPIGRLDVPAGWIAEVRLRWPAWLPRLILRGRRLDAFEGMPNARRGGITLKIRRRFRRQAEAMVAAIEQARNATPPPPLETLPEIDSGDVPRLSNGVDS